MFFVECDDGVWIGLMMYDVLEEYGLFMVVVEVGWYELC